MTEPQGLAFELKPRVEALELAQPKYRTATVTAVHPVTSSYDADVEGVGLVEGFTAPAHFLPAVGDVVRLPLQGPVVAGFEPGRIAEGAVGDRELAEPVKQQITVALDTANGKNRVSFSLVDPPASGYTGTVGDLWFKRASGTGVVTGSWEWDGTAFQPRSFGDQVLDSLTAGKIVSGTGVFDLLMAGSIYSAASGSRYRIDAAGIRLYKGAGATPTVDLNAVTGDATFRGTVEGALIRTSSSGQRLEIQSGGTAGGRTITFYPAGAGAAATVYSRDDAAGNAGVSMEAGGPTRGFLNFTSAFAAVGYRRADGASSFVRVGDEGFYGLSIGVGPGTGILLNSPLGIDFYNGGSRYANWNPDVGLEGVGQFSLTWGKWTHFRFGVAAGGVDADVYALRFVSTNPGGTGGFIYFSDRRLKRNARPVRFDALAEVLAMPVTEFEWESTGQTSFGFQAQEMPPDVQVRLSPDSPMEGVDDPIGIASELVMAKLVKAVQQLNEKVDSMRGRAK